MLVLRYIDIHNNVQQRFFKFIPLQHATADTIATALMERLSTIPPEGQESKLITQAYEGAAVMRRATGGVQRKVKDVYGSAHYVHCYAHQLNLIMQQATSRIPRVSTFFSDLRGFAELHSSPGRSSELPCLIKWWHTDFLELRPQCGTSTVVLLTMYMITRMIS